MREIIFYESDFGDKPVEDFLIGLEASARAKVVRSLEIAQQRQKRYFQRHGYL